MILNPARAEVNFGKNVFIGGHNFSHQHYDRKHRLYVKLHRGTPRKQGCQIRHYRDGSQTRVCNLKSR